MEHKRVLSPFLKTIISSNILKNIFFENHILFFYIFTNANRKGIIKLFKFFITISCVVTIAKILNDHMIVWFMYEMKLFFDFRGKNDNFMCITGYFC